MTTRNRFFAISAATVMLAIAFLAMPEGIVGKMLRSAVSGTNPGLITQHTFDNTLSDSSGNGNNGTNFGATFTAVNKKIGTHALQFNGTSNYFTAGTKASIDTINTGVSVSAWVYSEPVSNSNLFQVIAQRTKSGTWSEYFVLGIQNNKLKWIVNPSGTDGTLIETPIETNRWYHVVGTYNGTTMKLYVDNVSIGSGLPKTGTFPDDSTPLLFGAGLNDQPPGAYPTGPVEFFKGIMDETSVYNYALTTDEINALYTGISTPSTTIPLAPTLTSANPEDSKVTLTWNAPASDGGSEITGYIIEYTKSSEDTCLEFDGTISMVNRTASITGLENGTEYKFRVYAKNAIGQSENPSNQMTATPTAGPVSYTVTATAGTNGTIDPSTRPVNHGSTTTFTVNPNTGYTATITGTCGGTLSDNIFTTNSITSACTVIASFNDTTAPNPPARPIGVAQSGVVLSPSGETITFSSGVTSLSFKVGCTTGEKVKLYDGTSVTALLEKECSNNPETLAVNVSSLSNISYIKATLTDSAGNESYRSDAVTVMKDSTVNPAPGTPDMQESSDSGRFNTDSITNKPQPLFRLDCISGYQVRLYDGDTSIREVDCASNTADITPTSPLSPGTHILTARQSNSASWNTAASSNPLSITIDTTAPAVSVFDIPETLTVLTVPITTFTASEANVAYLITDTATPAPQANDARWSTTPPLVYSSFTTAGMKTLYPWVQDVAGNVSTAAHSDFVTITLSDTTAPSVPTNLNVSQVTHNSATITWSSSTDTNGIKDYLIMRNGTLIDTINASRNSYTETGLSSETNYIYTIKARDNANNASPLSAELSVKTGKTPTTGGGGSGGSSGGTGSVSSKVNGQCNTSLTTFSTPTPTKNSLSGQKLCKTGTASTVTYTSSDLEWTYSCRGSGGGTSSSCVVSASLNAAPVSPTCDLKTVKKLPLTSCKLNSNSFINFHKYLSCLGVVTAKNTCTDAGCGQNATRQDLAAMAVRVREIPLESGYKCQKNHTDTVNGTSSWVCEVVEKAQVAGLISATNKQFRPLSTITRSEAYSILLKSICVHPETTSQNWQTEVAKTALKYGFSTRSVSSFEPNKPILRQELFVLTARVAEWKAKNPNSCGALPDELVCK